MTATHVRLDANGLYWKAVWRTPDGDPRSKSLGARSKVSKQDAKAACRAIAADFARDPAMASAGGSMTLGAWRTRYFAVRTDLKGDSANDQQTTFGLLVEFLGEGRRLDKITESTAADFRLWLEARKVGNTDRPVRTATVRKHVRNCLTVFEWAGRQHKVTGITVNPFRHEKSAVPALAREWATVTRPQLAKILEAATSPDLRCLFALARLAGLRAGEALRLTWADVDWDGRVVRVWPESAEGQAMEEGTKQRAREVPLQPDCYAVLRTAYDAAPVGSRGPCAALPGGDWKKLHGLVKAATDAAGVPRYAKPLHTLRKNLETEWMREHPVVTVCQWLGNSPAVAAAAYVKAEQRDVDKVTKAGNDPASRIAELRAELSRLENFQSTPKNS